jgi:hypothetical protein
MIAQHDPLTCDGQDAAKVKLPYAPINIGGPSGIRTSEVSVLGVRMNIDDSRIIARFQCLLTGVPGRERLGQ